MGPVQLARVTAAASESTDPSARKEREPEEVTTFGVLKKS